MAKSNKGAAALQKVIDERDWSMGDMARAIHAATGAVPRWISGARKPGVRFALILHRLFGIHVEWWQEEAPAFKRGRRRPGKRRAPVQPAA